MAGVCPNSFDNDFISGENKLYIGFLGVFPSYHFILQLMDYYKNHQDIAAFLLIVRGLVDWINFPLGIIPLALNLTLILNFSESSKKHRKLSLFLTFLSQLLSVKKLKFGIVLFFVYFLRWEPFWRGLSSFIHTE